MPQQGHRIRVAFLLSLAVSFALSAAIPAGADTASQLKAAESKLQQLTAEISTEGGTLSSLQAQATAIAVQVGQVEDQIHTTEGRISSLQQAMAMAVAQQALVRQELDLRAWVAYESGPATGVEFVLGSRSLADLNNRVEIVNQAAQSDADLIAQIVSWRTVLATRRAQLSALEASLQGKEAALGAQQQALLAKAQATQQVLAQLSADQIDAARLVRQLKAKRAREIALARLLAASQQGFSGTPGGATTYRAWASIFLQYMRLSTCVNNQVVIVAWEMQEGTAAAHNPLDTELPLPGSTNFNSVGVQNYVSLEQGLQATALTLAQGAIVFGYGRIVSALAACPPPLTSAQAIAASNWCGICWPTYVVAFLPQAEAAFGL